MIKFGTSGFRGIIADNFTKENVQKIAYAVANILIKEGKTDKTISFGYDNRFMGKEFAEWMSEVLLAYGLRVEMYSKSVPCTLIAYEVKHKHLGLYITASHNPFYYSGVKIFVNGAKEPDKEFTDKIEKIANKVNAAKIPTMSIADAEKKGLITYTDNIKGYCDNVVKLVGTKNIKGSGVRILFNPMHGATSECTRYIFKKLGLEDVIVMNENPDPYFGGGMPAPYKHNLGEQVKMLKAKKCDFGFAVDGDGDRVTFIDKTGETYDCNYIAVVMYYYLVKYRKFKGDFVRNIAFTSLLDKVVKSLGGNTHTALVGFKNVAKGLQNTNSFIGAETNGIAFKDHVLHKDGILCGLMLVDIICAMKKPLSSIIKAIKEEYNYPCEEVECNYETTASHRDYLKKKIYDKKELPKLSRKILKVDYSDGMKMYFENDYWAMVRFSGTECVMRLFVELETAEKSYEMVKELEKFIELTERQ